MMLKINELFYSIQGEGNTVGFPTVFIRTSGCPIRCSYCDSAYAFNQGKHLSIDEIIKAVSAYKVRHVLLTGGEPLAQEPVIDLMTKLSDLGYQVAIETGGFLSIEKIDKRVSVILDVKTPGSYEDKGNNVNNYLLLKSVDQLKFVICSREDFDWAKQYIAKYDLLEKCQVIFSPSYQELADSQLADWILAEQLPVRFQVQLHKVLWGDVPGK